jgi:hypothetical protein
VIRVDVHAPFDKGRLVAQRRAPKVPAGDLPDPVLFDRVRGLDASLYRCTFGSPDPSPKRPVLFEFRAMPDWPMGLALGPRPGP